MQWQKCFGGTDDDYSIGNILENPDGTYVFSGSAGSSDGDISFNHGGGSDFWIAKISSKGHTIWQHSYGGSGFDDNTGLVKVNDGYISSGTTTSNDGDVTGNHGAQDAWVIKLDESGGLIWSKSLGGSGDEFDNAVTKTTDGNIVLGCVTLSNDGNVGGSQFGDDMWLVKVNVHTGKIIWQKCYGTPSYGDGAFGIFATADGGVVGTGAMGTIPFYQPGHNVFVLKAGVNGNKQWAAIFGGSNGEEAYGGMEISDGKFIIICQTASSDGDVKNNHGGSDTWFLTLDKCGRNIGANEELNNSAISSEKELLQSANLKVSPNPFSNSTIISFSLSQSQEAMPAGRQVSISIYDMTGRLVELLANAQMQPGTHQLTWNANDEKGNRVSAGIYFLKMQTENYVETKKIIVLK